MTMLEKLRTLSLRWQISILLAIAILVAMTAMGALVFQRSSDIVTEMTLDKMLSQTNEVAGHIESALRRSRADTAAIPGYPPIPGIIRCWDNQENRGQDPEQIGSDTEIWISRLAQIVTTGMKANDDRIQCALYDQTGNGVMRVVARGDRYSVETEKLANVSQESYFQQSEQLSSGNMYVSPMHLDGRGNLILHICTPFFSQASAQAPSEFRGVFVLTLDGGVVFANALNSRTVELASANQVIEIIDEEMKFIYCNENSDARSFSSDRFDVKRPVRAAKLLDTSRSGIHGAGEHNAAFIPGSLRPDGESMLGTYRRVYYDPSDKSRFWAVTASEFGYSALKSVMDLRNSVVVIGIAVSLFVFLLSYFVAGRLTSSLRQLTRAADMIAGGNIDGEFPEIRGIGEVARLDCSFRAMTKGIRNHINESKEQRARTEAIIDSTADGIVTLSSDGTILSANAATSGLFGYTATQLVGQNIAMICRALGDSGAHHKSRVLQGGEVRSVGPESQVSGRHRDGSEIPLAVRVSEMNYAGENLFIATVQNIAARKQNEQERAKLFAAIRDAVNRLAAASQQILATTSEQAAGAQQQAATVSEVVATAEEISQTAAQAAERAGEVASAARQTDAVGSEGLVAIEGSVAAMDDVRSQVESIAENMLSLAERAQAIGEITATVNDIAEQTNVLALNAAVEASRAGEHGKGFAVVATEVKSLAEQSKRATAQVRAILGEIQQATNAAVLSTEHGTRTVGDAAVVTGKAGETIKSLVRTLAESSQMATQISASANQQAAGVGQLNEGIRNIDTVSKQNVEAIRQIEQAARNLNGLSNELASLTEI
jgi:PAS domain S-box-containing protein